MRSARLSRADVSLLRLAALITVALVTTMVVVMGAQLAAMVSELAGLWAALIAIAAGELVAAAAASKAAPTRAAVALLAAVAALVAMLMLTDGRLELSMTAIAVGGALGGMVVAMMRYGEEAAAEELPASAWGRALWWRLWAPIRDVARAVR